jgi:hypothetical protein
MASCEGIRAPGRVLSGRSKVPGSQEKRLCRDGTCWLATGSWRSVSASACVASMAAAEAPPCSKAWPARWGWHGLSIAHWNAAGGHEDAPSVCVPGSRPRTTRTLTLRAPARWPAPVWLCPTHPRLKPLVYRTYLSVNLFLSLSLSVTFFCNENTTSHNTNQFLNCKFAPVRFLWSAAALPRSTASRLP